LIILIALLAGLMVGSFLNVVILRLPRDESVVTPRSRCPHCSSPIAWYDNIPVFSFLVLRGRCRHCQTSISLRYPLVELLCATLFVAVAHKFPVDGLIPLREWPFVAILLAITFIDLDHRIIPDELSLGGLILGLASSFWVPGLGLVSSLIGATLGYGVFFLMSWIYFRWKGKIGLGGGDVKLLAMIGAFLGPQAVIQVVMLSSLLGSVVGLSYATWLHRRGAADSVMAVAIPFGPFLVVAALYFYLLGDVLGFPVQL
jgi:leader peptidase (prepilin peptidase)/N-methyltransferase